MCVCMYMYLKNQHLENNDVPFNILSSSNSINKVIEPNLKNIMYINFLIIKNIYCYVIILLCCINKIVRGERNNDYVY